MGKAIEVEIEAMAIAAANSYAGNGSSLGDKEVARREDKLLDNLREKGVSVAGLALAKRVFERRLLELAVQQSLIRRPKSILASQGREWSHRNAMQLGGNHGSR